MRRPSAITGRRFTFRPIMRAAAAWTDCPASIVIANHAMGIYELAALHLTAAVPALPEASLAIDALAALLDGLRGRLGEAEETLTDALVQLRRAYLEVHGRAGVDASSADEA